MSTELVVILIIFAIGFVVGFATARAWENSR